MFKNTKASISFLSVSILQKISSYLQKEILFKQKDADTSCQSSVPTFDMRACINVRCRQQRPWCIARLPLFSPLNKFTGQILALLKNSRSGHAESTPWGGGALVLDGRSHAEHWKREISAKVALRKNKFCLHPPGLAAIVIGDRTDSLLYVRRKGEACKEVGIRFHLEHLPENTNQRTVIEVLRRLNADDRYHGILLQLPVPSHLNESRLLELINPRKDVDGLHPNNVGRLAMRGTWRPAFMPCAPLGCMELLWRENISIKEKTVAVLGDSNVVGMPISWLLRDAGASSVHLMHGRGVNVLKEHNDFHNQASRVSRQERSVEGLLRRFQEADIIVSAVGSAGIVRSTWVKPGAIIIDVGINAMPRHVHSVEVAAKCKCKSSRDYTKLVDSSAEKEFVIDNFSVSRSSLPDFRIVGDVAAEEVSRIAGAMTPVPGGIGPMTIAALLSNTYLGASRQDYF
jgi:methylenetetrahydrofolate dehydrogenase (NADP+) / methenyltetrahydrofolate cyclohydrolase